MLLVVVPVLMLQTPSRSMMLIGTAPLRAEVSGWLKIALPHRSDMSHRSTFFLKSMGSTSRQ